MTEAKKVAVVNYTPEQTAALVESYTNAPTRETVEIIALELGKSVRSVVAKLSREGVYKKPVPTSKTGGAIVKKDALVDKLMGLIDLTEPEASSFAHVNKTALLKLVDALTPTLDAENEEISEPNED